MKIGTTSWMEPGTYYHNAGLLAGKVDFVELLVLTWDADTETLLKKEIPQLKNLGLSYTVHLPTDSMNSCEKAYSFFASSGLKILNFTLHPLSGWENFIKDREDVSLENLIDSYPIYQRMTLDIGHMVLAGLKPAYFSGVEIKEIHLSGVANGIDHLEVTEKELKIFNDFIKNDLLINIEVFELKTFFNSIGRLKKWQRQIEQI